MAIESYSWGKAAKNGAGRRKTSSKRSSGPAVKKPKKVKVGYSTAKNR